MTALPNALGMPGGQQDVLAQLQAIRQQLELEEQQAQEAAARAAIIASTMQRMPLPGGNQGPGQVDPSSQGRMSSGVERGGPPTGPQFNPQSGLTDYLPPHPAMPTMSLPPPSAPAPSTLDPEWGKMKQLTEAEKEERRADRKPQWALQRKHKDEHESEIAARKLARQQELENRQLRVAARGMGMRPEGLETQEQFLRGEPLGLAALMEMHGPQFGQVGIERDPAVLQAKTIATIGGEAARTGAPVDWPALMGALPDFGQGAGQSADAGDAIFRAAAIEAKGDPVTFAESVMKNAGSNPLPWAQIEQKGREYFGDIAWEQQDWTAFQRLWFAMNPRGTAVTRRPASPDATTDISRFPVTPVYEQRALGR